MAIAFVQARSASSQSAPTSLAYTSPLTAGNTAFVCLGYTDNSVDPTGCTDNNGNTYSLLKRSGGTLPSRATDIWICNGVVGGAATVTVTWNGSKSGIGICILEYTHDVGQQFTIDQQNSDSDNSAVLSFPHGSITTTVADELILTSGHITKSGGGTLAAPAGYTRRSSTSVTNSVFVMERIVSATETTNPTATCDQACAYRAQVVSLKQIADSSGIRWSQAVRLVAQAEAQPEILFTQAARQVMYPFTCTQQPARDISHDVVFYRNRWGLERFDIKTRSEDEA